LLKVFLLLLLTLLSNSLALELSMNSAKENNKKYSTLHLRDIDKFLCQREINDFKVTTKVICAFAKQPSQDIKKLQNDFFTIDTQIKKKTFFLIIKPFKKMKLIPIVFNLAQDNSIYSSDVKLSKHWMIIGYDEELPLIKEQKYNENATNFPFIMGRDKLPYVGGLDVQGRPVKVKQVQDIKEFVRIKDLYAKDEYDRALDKIEDVLLEYPDTLFQPELLFYKIRIFDKMDRHEGLIELSKVFLREYSSNDNIAEVLSVTAKAYSKLGQRTNADYFFDRLFDEHRDTKYSKWGFIYKGEMLESEGVGDKSAEYYERALKETDDIDIAATAAFKLAQYHLIRLNKEKASSYIDKIVKAKPSFFKERYFKSKEVMDQFLYEGEYKSAADIAGCLLEGQDKDDEDAEWLLRSQGIWLSKSQNKIEALEPLKKYIKLYDYGRYLSEVKIAKDGLFFDESVNDSNLSGKLARFDELMEVYKGDSIGDRAIYEKAKVLNTNQMFEKVLDMEDKLLGLDESKYKNIKDIIHEAAVGFMKDSLEKRRCNLVLVTSNKYKVTLSDEWDDGIYECAMQGSDYELARKTSTKNLNSKNIIHRKKWLYRHIKLDFATGNYSDVLEASKELIKLVDSDKDSPYLDIYRTVFDTYQRLERNENMLDAIVDLERIYGVNYKDIERYIAILGIGVDKKDNAIVVKYGNYIMDLQNSAGSYLQSPYVEFSLFEAYMDIENYDRSLDVISSLEKLDLKTKDKARQKYLLGSVYTKLWRDGDAIKAYDEVIKLDPNSAWAELAKSAKTITKVD